MRADTQLKILPTDKSFTDSPDVGDPACLCSRCGKRIGVEEVPTRATLNGRLEYRYCDRCTGGALVETVCIEGVTDEKTELTMGWG